MSQQLKETEEVRTAWKDYISKYTYVIDGPTLPSIKCFVAGYEAALTTQQGAQDDLVAWRWNEGKHWFNWTCDWSHYDRAKSMGFEIEHAYRAHPATKAPATSLSDGRVIALAKARVGWVSDLGGFDDAVLDFYKALLATGSK